MKVIEEFRSWLAGPFLSTKFINYNEIKDISEVEITEKSSKIPLNKEFGQIKFETLLYFQIFSIK